MKTAFFNMDSGAGLKSRRVLEEINRYISGITKINVDLSSRRMKVDYDEHFKKVLDRLEDAVHSVGYKIRKIHS